MKTDLRKRQSELEREGRFDVDMNEVHRTFDAQPTGGDFEYLPKRPSEKFRRLWLLSVVSAVGPVINFFASGVKVRGKKNLRALKGKGAISVCNHVLTLDTLILKNALGPFRLFNTGSYYLMKKGWAGRIFKAGGFLPVGTTLQDMKKLQEAIGELVQKGKIVNFYPEHALWPGYKRIRPFKAGAFHYAAKFGVPVLPVFIGFRMTKLRKFFHRKEKAIVHILPAGYPPEEGALRERARLFSEQVYRILCEEATRFYGENAEAAAYALPQGVQAALSEAAPAREAQTAHKAGEGNAKSVSAPVKETPNEHTVREAEEAYAEDVSADAVPAEGGAV